MEKNKNLKISKTNYSLSRSRESIIKSSKGAFNQNNFNKQDEKNFKKTMKVLAKR